MNEAAVSKEKDISTETSAKWPAGLGTLYCVQGLASIGAVFVTMGLFFFTKQQFGWGARGNLLLCTGEGAVYIAGALGANPVSRRLGRKKLLRTLHVGLALTALAALCSGREAVVVAAALVYTLLSAAQWPLLESLISGGAEAEALSRRITLYNLMWSGTAAVTFWTCGPILVRFPKEFFLPVLAVNAVSFLLMGGQPEAPETPHAHGAEPEPELISLRTLAMRLSRVVLPATYAVTFALTALMPTLPVILAFPESYRPLVGSVWMLARWVSFVLLGTSAWWHTRPCALLVAAVALFASFLGCTLWVSLAGMIVSQIGLGLAIGLIYSGSLYFGMVLSSGSTEHGGYHEALIGAGSVLGPGAGAIAGMVGSGGQNASAAAVAIVLWVSIMTAAWVSIASGKRAPR